MNSQENNSKNFGKSNNSPPTSSSLGKGSKNRDFQNSMSGGPNGSFSGGDSQGEQKRKRLIGKAADSGIEDEDIARAWDAAEQQAEQQTKQLVKRIKKRMMGCVLAVGVGIILFVLAIGVLIKLVEPITAFVAGVVDTIKTVVKEAQNFLEKTRNLFLYGYFKGNEELLLKSIVDKSEEFQKKYGRPLNVPLVASTAYFDGETDETKIEYVPVTVNGKEELVPKVSNEI